VLLGHSLRSRHHQKIRLMLQELQGDLVDLLVPSTREGIHRNVPIVSEFPQFVDVQLLDKKKLIHKG